MALLSKANRVKYFEACGFGEFTEANILKLQKKYFPHYTGKTDNWDGAYGRDTDNLLRHCYNVFKCTKNFQPQEFKCGCGGKYCTGYPTYMRQSILNNAQDIRTKYGKPMTIACGLRCPTYNKSLPGNAGNNSKHLDGKAIDFYMRGVTDTPANRKKTIKYCKTLKDHNYTYGNGNGVYAPNMGNALHTDVK